MAARSLAVTALSALSLCSCGAPQSRATGSAPVATAPPAARTSSPPVPQPTQTLAEDLAFLRAHGDVQVLEGPGGARVVVSAKYQGRVMTAAIHQDAQSLGWIHRKFIEEGRTGTQFDNYGGADRFWLGPEGGQFGLYFPPGKPFTFEHWQTPAAFQEGTWDIAEQTNQRIVFRRSMTVTNYRGTRFDLDVERIVEVASLEDVEGLLGTPVPPGVQFVGYQTYNAVRNAGPKPWTRDGGLLSIWILAMYPPSPDTVVVVPFDANAKGPILNDAYFGKVPTDRLVVDEASSVALFRCDGQHRSKIGISPERTRSALGSYSASSRLLTLVLFNGPLPNAPYVNSMWEHQSEPFAGDVVNSYNDGPTEPGKPALGGFYEIETSSAGLDLAPGQGLQHAHRTFHFVGDEAQLDPIARAHLGVSLAFVRERMPAR